jgi:hypothetical protein
MPTANEKTIISGIISGIISECFKNITLDDREKDALREALTTYHNQPIFNSCLENIKSQKLNILRTIIH